MNDVQFNSLADHPEDAERYRLYCDRDVETEAAADARMVPLSASEQETWLLSERINDRGIRIDMRSVRAGLALAGKALAAVNAELHEITAGRVDTINQVQALKGWLIEQGVPVEKLGAADVVDLLDLDDLTPIARRALELRQEAKSSVAKLDAFVDRVSADDRARGAFLYHAAGTGRWSSTGIQLHNLPRPRKVYEDAELDTRVLFEAIRTAEPDWLRFLYGDDLGRPLHLLADAIRGFLWAAPGHDLIACDYSNIEGRVAAWLAGEAWKVSAFRQADDGGPGVYEQTAAGIFNCAVADIGKKDPRRQVGKVAELALGYQGGVAAFHSFSRLYYLKLEPILPTVWASSSAERRERAEERYEECLERKEATTQRMTREAWLAAELVKVGWRVSHPAITATWKELEQAARDAVEQPGVVVRACMGRIAYVVKGGFLWCRLPGGRCLCYGKPQIRDVEAPWADKTQEPEKREKRPCVTVLGVDSATKRWLRYPLYGGLIFENVVQAIARDILTDGMKRCEAAGYPIVLHVHDEAVAESARGWGSVAEMKALLCDVGPVYEGLPIVSDGWRGKRYRK